MTHDGPVEVGVPDDETRDAPSTRSRGSYAKSATRRREIIEAGIEVFAASGFRGGSIREIAERVGMSQAGLLHHFSSKTELLAAILERRGELQLETVRPGRGVETVRGLLQLIDDDRRSPGLIELHCVLSAEATDADHPAHAYFVRRYQDFRELLERAFLQMAADGQLVDDVDAAQLSRTMIGLWDGLQLQWLLDRESLDIEQDLRAFLAPSVTVEL